MPSIETFITFLLALTLLEISPGPDMMLTIARGVGQGRRIALLTVLGNVFVAGFVQVSFLVLGLVTVVHACPVPKSLLFMFAFLPQFVDPAAGPVWLQLLVLGSIQKVAGIISLGSVAMASGTFGNWLSKHPGFIKWQERFTGVVMIGLGIRMLFSGSGVVSKPSS
ncbi:lysine transporter LysE [Klebsiella variicola]|uniref:LysE family translocator n=1 Tax=Klebsiella variicola TaxID=244366 RepID=UPI002181D51A|nr:LysE family translocator [Klebsiella variicola]GKN24879.1 lysine transporter LysE [Klebsiella variicola]